MSGSYEQLTNSSEEFVAILQDFLSDSIPSEVETWTSTPVNINKSRFSFRYSPEQHVEDLTFDSHRITPSELISNIQTIDRLQESIQRISYETNTNADHVIESLKMFENNVELFIAPANIQSLCDAAIEGDRAVVELIFGSESLNPEQREFVEAAEEVTYIDPDFAVVYSSEDDITWQHQPSGLDNERDTIELSDGRQITHEDGELFEVSNNRPHQLEVVENFTTVFESDEQEAFVVGVDDTPTGVFVHSIDLNDVPANIEDANREDIYQAMGFDTQLADTELTEINNGDRVRLQGDLAIRQTSNKTQIRHQIDSIRKDIRREIIEERLESYLEDEFEGVKVSATVIEDDFSLEVGFEAVSVIENIVSIDVESLSEPLKNIDFIHPETATQLYMDGFETTSDVVLLTHSQFASKAEASPSIYREIMVESKIGEYASELRHIASIPLVERGKEILSTVAPSQTEIEARVQEEISHGQTNLPIDNHLVLIGDAEITDMDQTVEPVTVTIWEETTLHLLHDEHDQVTTKLTPGIYEFYLLPRGGLNPLNTDTIDQLNTGLLSVSENTDTTLDELFDHEQNEFDTDNLFTAGNNGEQW